MDSRGSSLRSGRQTTWPGTTSMCQSTAGHPHGLPRPGWHRTWSRSRSTSSSCSITVFMRCLYISQSFPRVEHLSSRSSFSSRYCERAMRENNAILGLQGVRESGCVCESVCVLHEHVCVCMCMHMCVCLCVCMCIHVCVLYIYQCLSRNARGGYQMSWSVTAAFFLCARDLYLKPELG